MATATQSAIDDVIDQQASLKDQRLDEYLELLALVTDSQTPASDAIERILRENEKGHDDLRKDVALLEQRRQ